ncbi:mushroom body large-type Kenyon cell-specific protein 1-like isoform X3 [Anopheles arabiensis]|uniref:mushroom body large-type Kenyon cell-specific protein 1-like isoform X3 n=1 Tax=Anopheles arabiensis TaxID=7173 RepID=UPI001AADCD0B|nr:mushroom body large-type Kenyon cell-specific protein 1-like isoform X3 [Anopheles arabiensis]XP_040175001.1 mushroom body large-type Kenyon cell-specific protein 1-like isoform X3 [Anopheles arabiensis]XP_040175002.1 mushroom body large-type Kenyon cell-specific protein 1-like isoform X3 [Anopheles arabiensis]XP_040175003.1 mushroom body large-type Kenyon cell-specific protein 1-like isoform X3 [Anopheles arabiensis]XP_040175004.1 mushroom body large-type Kenyon cell-specific protein 1-like
MFSEASSFLPAKDMRLERVAEELMGRRKWKHYQDVLTRQQLNLLDPSTTNSTEDDLLTGTTGVAAAAAAAAAAATAAQLHQGQLMNSASATAAATALALAGGGMIDQKTNHPAAIVAAANAAAVASLTTPAAAQAAANTTAATAIVRNGHCQQDDVDVDPKTAASASPDSPRAANCLASEKHSPSSARSPRHGKDDRAASPVSRNCHTNDNGTATPRTGATDAEGTPPLSASPSGTIERDSARPKSTSGTEQAALVEPSIPNTPDRGRASSVASPDLRGEQTATEHAESMSIVKQEPIEHVDPSPIKSEQPNPEVAVVPKLPIVGTNNNNNIINSNNNTIQHRSNGMAIEDGSAGTKPLTAETPVEPEAATPVDWKPQDKCYFCVDGKLLTVNETGELVPESGPAPTEAELRLNRRAAAAAALAESDSDTSESSEPELLASLLSAGAAGGMSNKSLVALLREAGASQNLPSLQSFVAQYTAAASLQGLQPNLAQLYNPALWYSQLQQQMSPSAVETVAGGAATAALSPTTAAKMAAQLGAVGGTGEQPLDLSAKPGTSGMTSLLSSMMDPKHLYKAKPRLSPVGGRKTYTEDGLQNALQDILSGRLGTRRAAMQYGIPRSTLRNKVYKMALGGKRGMSSLLEDDDDKDSQDGDMKDGDLLDKLPQQVLADMLMKMCGGGTGTPRSHETNLTPTPPATATPPAQHATPEPAALDIAGMSLKPHPSSQSIAVPSTTPRLAGSATATPPATTQPPQSSPLVAAAASTLLNPNLVMQVERILQVTATAQASGETQQALAELPELLRKIIDQQQLLADQIKKASVSGSVPAAATIQPSVAGSAGGPSPTIHGLAPAGSGVLGNASALDAALARSPSLSAALSTNGGASQAATAIDPCYLPFLQQLQQQQQGKLRTMSAGTPDTPASLSSLELNDVANDDPHVILKIPSYGRAPGASPGVPGVPASSKNGDLERHHLHHHNLTTPSPPTAAAAAVLSSLVGTPARTPHSSGSPQAGLLNSAVTGGAGMGGVASAPTSSQVSLASSLSSSSPLSSLSVASSVAVQQERASLGGSAQTNHLSVISPPLMNLRGAAKGESALSPPASGHGSAPGMTSGGKPMLSVHDVIARSISKNFQQHQQSDIMHKQQMEQMKRPSISVIKTLGDISHFGSAAAAAAGLGSVGSAAQLAAAAAAAAANNTGTGGKGTRPKRGKYRNYDRDSLVEAVKAVQRGEMSVHRAGSYYGVPHSTLEYKVKERHLMRPRKREPKPQPGLDDHRLGGSSSGKGSSDGASSLRGLDKGKGGLGLGAGSKGAAGLAGHSGKNHHHLQQQVQQAQFPNNSPNGALGAKMPMFDASAMGYGASFFWPHTTGFSGMPSVDYARSQPAPDVFSSPTLMQRFQQEATASALSPADSRHFPGGKASSAGVGSTNANLTALPKGSSVREMAEQLYDGSGANGGSFLDDIIRQSLDKKSGDFASHSALFDHLLKGKLRSTVAAAGSVGSAEDANTAALHTKVATKRAATSPPIAFHPESIKRERASPGASSTSSTGSSSNRLGVNLGNDQQHHGQNLSQSVTGISTPEQLAKNVESLMKLHENLSSMSAAHLQRTAMEELNGTQGSTASRASLLGHQSDSVDLHGSDGETDTDSVRSHTNHHGHSLRHSLQQQQHHHHQRGLTDDSS